MAGLDDATLAVDGVSLCAMMCSKRDACNAS